MHAYRLQDHDGHKTDLVLKDVFFSSSWWWDDDDLEQQTVVLIKSSNIFCLQWKQFREFFRDFSVISEVPFGKSGQKSTKLCTAGVRLEGKLNLDFHLDRTNGLGMATVQSRKLRMRTLRAKVDAKVAKRRQTRPSWRVMSEFGTSKLWTRAIPRPLVRSSWKFRFSLPSSRTPAVQSFVEFWLLLPHGTLWHSVALCGTL